MWQCQPNAEEELVLRFGLFKRIAAGVGANAFGQMVNLVIQIASVPLFLHYWDVSTYGQWVLLSAAPAYFSMADVGVVSVAMNQMTMLISQGETKDAQKIFRSAGMFLFLMIGFALLISCVVTFLLPGDWLQEDAWRSALLILIACSLLGMGCSLFDAVFRASGRYAEGVYAINTVRLVEWGGMVLGVAWLGTIPAAASGMLIGRAVGSIGAWIYARFRCPIFDWKFQLGSFSEIRRMLGPAFGFMAFPIGNSISIQGMTMLVGALLGAGGLASFNAYRTISRSTIQLVSLLSHALWPEFSRLYGAGNIAGLREAFRRGSMASAALAISAGTTMYFLTPYVLSVWTHGKIAYVSTWGVAFAIATILGGLWHVPRIFLLAINKHISISVHYVCASVMMLVFSWGLGDLIGMLGALVAMIAFEAYMWGACYAPRRKVLGDDVGPV